MKEIVILGSTGSIGTQALQVIRENPERFRVVGLTCGNNVDLLRTQIEEFHPQIVVSQREEDAKALQRSFPKIHVYYGDEGLTEAAKYPCHIILNSLMGMRGLVPTYYAIKAGHDIALANKETLVTGGQLIMHMVKESGVKLLPVDSEHSAIMQCLQGNEGKKIKKILLTASGGPFRGFSAEQLEHVTLEQALNHPKWSMGKKITVDSATLMNKGLEIIEAKWLFDVPIDDIQVLVHPQSIVHSAVEYEDTSVIAQLGVPDMRIPISLALGYPDRIPYSGEELNFFDQGKNLTFEEPDRKVFRTLDLACEASKRGGSYPIAMNGANEVLVEAFLKGKIKFSQIQNYIEVILNAHKGAYNLGLNEIVEVDKEIRQKTLEYIDR